MSKFNLNENNLLFTVVSVDKIAKEYVGAEQEFKKGEEFTYDEIIDRCKSATESINGICEANFDYDNIIVLSFFAMNFDEENDDYIYDTCVVLKLGLYFENDKSLADLTNLIENDI